MNRLRFFSEMKKGMLQTVKAVSEPFLEEKLDQLDQAVDSILQLEWVLLTKDVELLAKVEQRFINGKNIIVLRTGEGIQAVSSICPVCSNLLCFSEGTMVLKCLMCEKEYSFHSQAGELALTFLPIRKQNNAYEIGINVDRK